MVGKLSTEASHCYVQASAYARRAKLASTPERRENFLRLEQGWLSLARSYELSDQLLVFAKENDCARNQRPLAGDQRTADKAEIAEGAQCGATCVLTAREQQVALLACTGLSNKEIGRALGLTEGSVKQYVCSLFRKLGIKRRMGLRDFSQFIQKGGDPIRPHQIKNVAKGSRI